MSFAVRTDAVYRCRQVGSPDEVLPYEVFSEVYVALPSAGIEVDLERSWRDGELVRMIWFRERHRDQQEMGGDTTLSGEQFSQLLVYLQALRDWPQSQDFPAIEHRPIAPAWLAGQPE